MPGYNRDHQRNIDNQSPPESDDSSFESLLDSLIQNDAPDWLADAVAQAVIEGDLAYLNSQVIKHTGWKP